jgi:hypothetical protein
MDQGMVLVELQRSDASLDFWTEPSVNGNTDIMATTTKAQQIISILERNGIEHSVLIEDVGQ